MFIGGERVDASDGATFTSGIPFGGFKKSGYGREINKSAMAHYQQVKAIEISIVEGCSGFYPQD